MTFNIIRVRGTPNKVILPDGTIIYRDKQDKIYIKGSQLKKLIPQLPVKDDDMVGVPKQDYIGHFIFVVPEHIIGPSYMCSCGAPANIYGVEAYRHGASPVGLKFLCSLHAETGRHAEPVS